MCQGATLSHKRAHRRLYRALLRSCLERGCLGDLEQVGRDSQSAPSCQGHNGRPDNEKERMTACLLESRWQKEHFYGLEICM